MPKKKIILLPKSEKILSQLGENIRLARLRRKLSAEQVSERANMGRSTLWKIEERKEERKERKEKGMYSPWGCTLLAR